MRSAYYVITIYDVERGRRDIICDTDYGLVAWFIWWKSKFNINYRYPKMEVST